MEPPWFDIIWWHAANPSPVPWIFVVNKGSNTRPTSVSLIPSPSSRNDIWIVESNDSIPIVKVPPSGMDSNAFRTRFENTC